MANVPLQQSGGGGGGAAAGVSSLTGDSVAYNNSGSTGAVTLSLISQIANSVFAGPTSGGAVAPTWRALVAGDIPNIAESQVTNLTTDLAAKQPTLTGTGLARNTGACTELSGAVTTSGSNVTTLVSPASVSEIDVDTLKLNIAKKDIVFTRSAAATLGLVGSPKVTGSLISVQLAAAAAPTVTPALGSASTWGYKIIARDTLGKAIASTEGTTATGAATLDGTHTCTVTWAAVSGAVSYDIFRSTTATSPTTKGIIGNVLADATLSFIDNGIAADGTAATAINTSGVVSQAGLGVSAGDGGYVWAMDAPDSSVTGTATIIAPTGVNNCLCFAYVALRTITIRKVVFLKGATNVAGATALIGIYDANKNKLIDSGTFDCSAGGAATQSNTVTANTLYAGELYWFVQSASDSTVTCAANLTFANGSAATMRNANVARQGTAANNASAGVLPTTLGVVTGFTTRTPIAILFET